MNLLEVMAKAHWADSENMAWESLSPEDRAHMLNMMRAALLALAEAELPDTVVAGLSEMLAMPDEFAPDVARGVFRHVLRAIAETPDA